MDLKQQLTEDLKVSMKQGETVRRDVIRTLRSAIKNAEINSGHSLSNDEVLAVIVRDAKQRRDSIAQFSAGNRPDLVEKEQAELSVVESYLPRQLTDDEIRAYATAAIAELGVTDLKGMGKVMGRLSAELRGKADGKRISEIVRNLLGSK